MKTYDPDIDSLLEELLSPWIAYTAPGEELAVSADVAERAAKLIFDMYGRLSAYDAEDYNRQMGCE